MICVRLKPVPRGPRTARMKGQPKRALYVGVELLQAREFFRACSG